MDNGVCQNFSCAQVGTVFVGQCAACGQKSQLVESRRKKAEREQKAAAKQAGTAAPADGGKKGKGDAKGEGKADGAKGDGKGKKGKAKGTANPAEYDDQGRRLNGRGAERRARQQQQGQHWPQQQPGDNSWQQARLNAAPPSPATPQALNAAAQPQSPPFGGTQWNGYNWFQNGIPCNPPPWQDAPMQQQLPPGQHHQSPYGGMMAQSQMQQQSPFALPQDAQAAVDDGA